MTTITGRLEKLGIQSEAVRECEHDQYCYRTLEWHILGGRRDKHYPSACDLFQRQRRRTSDD